jgi:hypothetical protein
MVNIKKIYIPQGQDELYVPITLVSNVYQEVLSMGVKLLGREARRSPPSNALVREDGIIPQFLHTSSWRGV